MFTDYARSRRSPRPASSSIPRPSTATTRSCRRAASPTIGCGAGGNRGRHRPVPLYIGRRNVEGGGRQQSFATARSVAWPACAATSTTAGAMTSGRSSRARRPTRRRSTTSSTPRLRRALDVVDVGGVPTCHSVIDGTDPNCVPWNVFVPGGMTQAQLNYIQASGLADRPIDQKIYNGVITGDLGIYDQVAARLRRHPARVRHRVPPRQAAEHGRPCRQRASSPAPAARRSASAARPT